MGLLLAALLFTATPAAAQDGWQNGGDGPPAPGSQAARDGFGAMLLLTHDLDGFLRAWNGPTPPNLPTTSQVERGRPVNVMLLFYGCGAGQDGNCNVTAEYTILQPDGRPYGQPQSGAVWQDMALDQPSLRLATSGLALRVEADEPLGNWILRARVTDHVRGVTLHVENRLTVEAPPAAPAN